MVTPEEIENCFARAGWHLDGSFSDYLIIGCAGDDLSILARKEAWETDDSFFELSDHERDVTYAVREIPTPQQARRMLQDLGQSPDE